MTRQLHEIRQDKTTQHNQMTNETRQDSTGQDKTMQQHNTP